MAYNDLRYIVMAVRILIFSFWICHHIPEPRNNMKKLHRAIAAVKHEPLSSSEERAHCCNCSIHKSQHLRNLYHENGIRLEFLFFRNNHIFQIGQCFLYIKAYLRRHREWVESLEDP